VNDFVEVDDSQLDDFSSTESEELAREGRCARSGHAKDPPRFVPRFDKPLDLLALRSLVERRLASARVR
jgi:hypothetical protein